MSENKKSSSITKTLEQGQVILCIGVVLALIMPYILTRPSIIGEFSFEGKGEIGDTIGGITAPFINLIGSILVFLALKAQIQANKLVQDQIDNEARVKELDNESSNLNLLYNHLNESISNFRFTTLPVSSLNMYSDYTGDTEKECMGGEAFYKMFDQILCHYHSPENILLLEQSASELYSLLTILDNLLDLLIQSKSSNKDILTTLIKHQFEYKITTRINYLSEEELKQNYCSSCKKEHGIPNKLLELILQVRHKLKN